MHKLSVKRPLKFLNLLVLGPKMSITAKVSILHRISGFLLFLSVPFLLYILNRSLTNADFYSVLYGVCSSVYMKVVYLVLLWAFFHHVCAGVRFLFLDVHRGVEVKTAKVTARLVVAVSLICTILVGVIIW
jgi:succinate dehydrogenase / fumarate reductase cytochrome b subunit